MGFFGRLFGKSAPKNAAEVPLARHQAPMDELVSAWQAINAADDRPWVLFEHGTCVRLTHPELDVLVQARALLTEWGPVYPGTSAGDFDVERTAGITGWLVTCHHPDIVTYVEMSAEQHISRSSDATDIAIGLLGRTRRDTDARELGAIHVEDHRPNRPCAGAEAVRAWARLAQRASQARHAHSDWKRFALPVEAIRFLTEEQAAGPRRALNDISMPPKVREQIEALESIVHKCGRLPKPTTALIGLTLAGSSHRGESSIGQLFAPGQIVELSGFVSGSALVDPPLYAAGIDGAVLEIGIHSAADMSAVVPRPGEAEYLLPRDCRCRVLGTTPDRSYRTQDGSNCLRAVVKLQQL